MIWREPVNGDREDNPSILEPWDEAVVLIKTLQTLPIITGTSVGRVFIQEKDANDASAPWRVSMIGYRVTDVK